MRTQVQTTHGRLDWGTKSELYYTKLKYKNQETKEKQERVTVDKSQSNNKSLNKGQQKQSTNQ